VAAHSIEKVAIVGASLAGMRAATALRDQGFSGSIAVIGDEPHTPYDRPPLSKQFLAGKWNEDRIELVAQEKLEALELDLRLGHRAGRLDVEGHFVEIDDGSRLGFDKAVIATGSHPRLLRGAPADGPIMTLRTIDESRRLAALISDETRLVVVGGGFIGSEVAATAKGLGADVTVVEALPVPLGRVLGDLVGAACAALHQANGVDVRTGTGVSAITKSVGGAQVTLDDGTAIEADVVVVGIGILPTTDWLEDSGLELRDGVIVDEMLHASDDVVAAGDVARWLDLRDGSTVRAEHWTNAVEQGAAAGRNLLAGREAAEPFRPLPYIWSDQYTTKIQVLGDPHPDDEVKVVDGSYEERSFVALYGRNSRLTAAVGFGRPRQLMSFRPLLIEGATFDQGLRLLSA
jgi:NADPH-dependent 2,4-dienoyl-CoA reductase/sulfur reductase-like enzyme